MAASKLIVIGASSGGVDATSKVVAAFPRDLDAAVIVVVHVHPSTPSVLPRILQRAGRLPAEHARSGTTLEPARIYVAPPDHHVIVPDGIIELSHGPRENYHRPAIDVTFRTAAVSYGKALLGVILSGALDDGTAGLCAVKRHGGITMVQDPKDAAVPGMPQSAVDIVHPHQVLPLAELGRSIVEHIAHGRAERRPARPGPGAG